MKKRTSKYGSLFQKVKKRLPPSFKKSILSSQIEHVVQEEALKERKAASNSFEEQQIKQLIQNKRAGIKRLVTKRLNEIKYKVYGNISPPKLYTFEKNIDGLEWACGLNSCKQYFSNLSAIYLLKLTNQRPLVHYLCKENHYVPDRDFTYDENLAKITFRNEARNSSRYVKYKETSIYFLEKQNLNMIGVIDLPFKKKDKDLFYIKCTNLERTFIDSIMTPQYSGGTSSILSFFGHTDLNLMTLKKIYQTLNPIYPYWQKIGFLLELMNQKKKSNQWHELFKKFPLKKFFLDRGYRNDWSFNQKWQLYHPKAIDKSHL